MDSRLLTSAIEVNAKAMSPDVWLCTSRTIIIPYWVELIVVSYASTILLFMEHTNFSLAKTCAAEHQFGKTGSQQVSLLKVS